MLILWFPIHVVDIRLMGLSDKAQDIDDPKGSGHR